MTRKALIEIMPANAGEMNHDAPKITHTKNSTICISKSLYHTDFAKYSPLNTTRASCDKCKTNCSTYDTMCARYW